MGKRYDVWNADPELNDFLKAKSFKNLQPPLDDAFEAIILDRPLVYKQLHVGKTRSAQLLQEHARMNGAQFKEFVNEFRGRTINRNSWRKF